MRPETYIAQRLYFMSNDQHRTSRPAVKVALAGITIGMLVMVITICVVVGFKQTIMDKMAGFGAHIQVVNFDSNNTYEMEPIAMPDSMLQALQALPHVRSAQRFWTKPGIVKTDSAFQGVVLKGTDYWDYFRANLVAGTLPQQENEVLLSQSVCRLLHLGIDDSFLCYFVGEQVRVRKFRIVGIYETGFKEYDELFMVGLPKAITRLNGWTEYQSSGVEVLVDDRQHISEVADAVYFKTANRLDEEGNAFYTQTLEQMNIQIFSWLDLLDMNVLVIIILMLCVSGFNIVSGLIILILDSVRLIGTLKALGADNLFIRRIFITQAAMLIGKGMVLGNVLGLGLCALQYFTHCLPLEASSYYVSYVPVAFPWLGWIALNLGTMAVSLLILLVPSAIISHISPAQVMHFE